MRLSHAVPLAALLGALLLGACDADIEQDDDVEPDRATVRTGLAALYAGADAGPEEGAAADCFADALLDRLSVDQLVEAELVQDDGTVPPSAPQLDVDTAGAWVDASESCTPYVETSARALAAQSKGKVDTAAYTACLTEAITPERLREALVATLVGDFSSDPAVAELSTAQAECARSASPPE
ncbi:hypothetical protein [Nocardioides litoris]|uniref:hypothetical protein n=1 Tax=Nocardioides litoris TaxID=1926648 RepID=UPI00111DA3EB|nr:hypothetical protein [Nocardioides litoris]